MTSRSWQYISCHWDSCSNHLAMSDFPAYWTLPTEILILRYNLHEQFRASFYSCLFAGYEIIPPGSYSRNHCKKLTILWHLWCTVLSRWAWVTVFRRRVPQTHGDRTPRARYRLITTLRTVVTDGTYSVRGVGWYGAAIAVVAARKKWIPYSKWGKYNA